MYLIFVICCEKTYTFPVDVCDSVHLDGRFMWNSFFTGIKLDVNNLYGKGLKEHMAARTIKILEFSLYNLIFLNNN